MTQASGVRVEKRLATDRDSFNLNLHVFRQTRDFYAGTRRESGVMLGEERFIRGIHGGEIVQIFHENGGFHDIAHFQASGFNDSFTLSGD